MAACGFRRGNRDLKFGWVYWSFGIFILACGLTHILSIYALASTKSVILIKPYRKAELAERLREALTANSMAS